MGQGFLVIVGGRVGKGFIVIVGGRIGKVFLVIVEDIWQSPDSKNKKT